MMPAFMGTEREDDDAFAPINVVPSTKHELAMATYMDDADGEDMAEVVFAVDMESENKWLNR